LAEAGLSNIYLPAAKADRALPKTLLTYLHPTILVFKVRISLSS